MELWVYFILGLSLAAAVTGAIDLNKIIKISQSLVDKFSKLSKEHQEINEEIQKLSKKLAK